MAPEDARKNRDSSKESESDVSSRRLAAIMFTDIHGYSKKMDMDETHAIALTREHYSIIRSFLPRYGGEEKLVIGDAFLVIFDSVIQAVQCAVELQKAMRTRNEQVDKRDLVEIRIGIHLGEIRTKDGLIFGDAVNVASRIEPLAEPGGIAVTDEVRKHTASKIDRIAFDSLGMQKLKNIQSRVVYRLRIRDRKIWPAISLKRFIPEMIGLLVLLWIVFLFPPGLFDSTIRPIGSFFGGSRTGGASDSVIIAAIDDKTFEAMQKQSPLNRAYLNKAVQVISSLGPKVIALDIIFDEPTNASIDHIFLQTLRNIDNQKQTHIVIGVELDKIRNGLYHRKPLLHDFEGLAVGAVNVLVDNDNMVTGYKMAFSTDDGRMVPNLGLAALASFDRSDFTGGAMKLHSDDDHSIIIEADDARPLNLSGSGELFPSFSLDDIMQTVEKAPDGQQLSGNLFKDKIVFIGSKSVLLGDYHETRGGRLAGVEIHANIIGSILSGSSPTNGFLAAVAICGIISIILLSLIFNMFNAAPALAAALSMAAIFSVIINYIVFSTPQYWAPVMAPVAIFGVIKALSKWI